ncbi:MAG: hypothetical protein U1F42_05700 [Candidatus Competibacteraceae bacterium]
MSTTTALALCVFCAVPFYGVRRHGVRGFLHLYLIQSADVAAQHHR